MNRDRSSQAQMEFVDIPGTSNSRIAHRARNVGYRRLDVGRQQ